MFRTSMMLKTVLLTLSLLSLSGLARAEEILDVELDVVSAHDTESYTMTLDAGVSYSIVVVGDHSTDLDFYLEDENRNVVAKDTDLTDVCALRVRPRWTGSFRLRIRNLGDEANLVRIALVKRD